MRTMISRHDVQAREGMPTRIRHPQVGDLTLSREKLSVGGAPGQVLVIYHAEPGTTHADKLALLASLASPAAPAPVPHRGGPDAAARPRGPAA